MAHQRVIGPAAWWLALSLLLLVGALLRFYSASGPGVVHDRQFRSFLIARALFFSAEDEIPAWRKHVAETSSRRQEALEPPLTEWVVAAAYRVVNRESFRLAQLVPAAFWMLGALPLIAIARKISDDEGAILAAAYYLLVPWGVLISTSLLPESLMVAGMLAGIYTILRYFEHPSALRLAISIAACGMAILIKPFVVFTLVGAFGALAIHESRSLRAAIHIRSVLFVLLSALPGAIYYGRGLIGADYLRWKVASSFLPHLLWSSEFWTGWLLHASIAVGGAAILIMFVALPLLRRSHGRPLVIGLGIGYVGFCLAFNFYVYSMEYYHAQLIPIVALALSPLPGLLKTRLMATRDGNWSRASFGVAACLGGLMSSLAVKHGHIPMRHENRDVAAAIGNLVQHSDRVAYVAYVYGLPLEYYGELAGESWPRARMGWPLVAGDERPRTIAERMRMLGFTPEYFVITNLDEFRRHHDDLRDFLSDAAELLASSPDYIIYRLHTGPDRSIRGPT